MESKSKNKKENFHKIQAKWYAADDAMCTNEIYE